MGEDRVPLWYPYGQAQWDSDGEEYVFRIAPEQIPDPATITFHAVTANRDAQDRLREWIAAGRPEVGLGGLPPGAESVDVEQG